MAITTGTALLGRWLELEQRTLMGRSGIFPGSDWSRRQFAESRQFPCRINMRCQQIVTCTKVEKGGLTDAAADYKSYSKTLAEIFNFHHP